MSILTNIAKKLCEKNVLDKKLHQKIGKELLSKWNIPLNTTNDLLTLRRDANSESDYILYHLICAIDKTSLPKGYPPEHLKEELNQKYNGEKIKFPLEYDMVSITDDQWIGKITARELFKLGNSSLINYNENAQRVMKRIVTSDGDHWVIKLNERAVSDIEDSFEKGRYIANTITLNIPQTDESDFYYDERTGKLVIKKIKMFDILDGYHRYVAINRLCAFNYDFDQPMELRITNFDDDRARQFIWQEDQKTKMSKIDSDSLNKYNTANIIVKKLQDNVVYGNLISYNKGIISSSVLSQAISIIYHIDNGKQYKISEIDKISKEILNGFDEFQNKTSSIFDAPMDSDQINCLIFMIHDKIFNYKKFCKLVSKVKELQLFRGRSIRYTDANKMKEILEGGV